MLRPRRGARRPRRGGGSRPYLWYRAGDYRGVIGFWKSSHSTRRQVDFGASVIALYQPTRAVYWRSGLDSLRRHPGGQWWEIHAGRPVEPVAEAVLAAVRDYAWPAILAALDAPGYPPEPGRRWPREFPPAGRRGRGHHRAAGPHRHVRRQPG